MNRIKILAIAVIGLIFSMNCFIPAAFSKDMNKNDDHCSDCLTGKDWGHFKKNCLLYCKFFALSDYWPLLQGSYWRYETFCDGAPAGEGREEINGTEIVNGVETIKWHSIYDWWEGTKYITLNDDGFVFHKQSEGDGATYRYNIMSPPARYMPAKMRLGQQYQSHFLDVSYKSDSSGGTVFNEVKITNVISELEGIEDVTVPAGTFKDCLKTKVTFSSYETKGDHEVYVIYRWSAKGVGGVKEVSTKYEFNPSTETVDTRTTTLELIEYYIPQI